MSLRETVLTAFEEGFGGPADILVRAPGRVNLIGEHTDYNDGFVLPMAIDRAVWIALRARPDRKVRVKSLNFQTDASFDLDDLQRAEAGWPEYLKGVTWALAEANHPVKGWDGVLTGDVPIGAGLSSSAALEMAAARAFIAMSGNTWDPVAMARAGQQAENEWIGVQSGIMDQLASASGRAGHALLVDCRSLEIEPVRLPEGATVIILDTATRRGLIESAYNERRAQCQAAARFFGIPTLRDLTPEALAAEAASMDPILHRRARHVVMENSRTLMAREAMRRGDSGQLGVLMHASHASLRDDYEVSSAALDQMVEIAQAQAGCHGARMTGAGFAGCAVALVESETVEDFIARVGTGYQQATGRRPEIYAVQASQGAQALPIGAFGEKASEYVV